MMKVAVGKKMDEKETKKENQKTRKKKRRKRRRMFQSQAEEGLDCKMKPGL